MTTIGNATSKGMTRLYLVTNEDARRIAIRQRVRAEIALLRKFESSSMVQDRIATKMTELRRLWPSLYMGRPSRFNGTGFKPEYNDLPF